MSRFGRLFVRRWSWTETLHRIVHRDPRKACFVCRSVWAYLETDPAFVEGIRQGEADIQAGRVRPWRDIR